MVLAVLSVLVCLLGLTSSSAHPQTLNKHPNMLASGAEKTEAEWPCPGTETACFFPSYHCCSPGTKCCGEKKGYCCPPDQSCGADETGCVKQDTPSSLGQGDPPILNDAVCPDKVCSEDSTCCETQDGVYGCCPLANAVCCDHQRCCATDYMCGQGFGHCAPLIS